MLIEAVFGDGRTLAALSARGELERVFWPRIDAEQQVERLCAGLRIAGGDLEWLHTQPEENVSLRYEPRTNAVRSVYSLPSGVRVSQVDFVPPGRSVIVRQYIVENGGPAPVRILAYLYAELRLGGHLDGNAVQFERDSQAMLHHRRNTWAAVGWDRPLYGFQAGNAQAALASDRLFGDGVSLGRDSATVCDLGVVAPGNSTAWTVFLAFGTDRETALTALGNSRAAGGSGLRCETDEFWGEFLDRTRPVSTGDERLDEAYTRSLLVFGLMSDAEHGGLIAAPEFDPGWTRCGGYGFCWGRDAAFIATAIDRAGLPDLGGRFYDWALRTQEGSGNWDQRYYTDGVLAPSWGFQMDEPASVVWGMWAHYRLTGDLDFLRRMYPAMRRSAEYLAGEIDGGSGLPGASMDLWEERKAVHAYSVAAVSAALHAAADAAAELGEDARAAGEWARLAAGLRERLLEGFWNPARGAFFRSMLWELPPGVKGAEPEGSGEVTRRVDDFGYERIVRKIDDTLDASLLGLSYPFALVEPNDPRVESTARAVREALWARPAGGILRYEGDAYIGGNPWILTTLWVGLEAVSRGDLATGREMLQWAAAHRTRTGLLPEQVDRESGRPAWVAPLTWSHAMFVLLFLDLVEAGDFRRVENEGEARAVGAS